MARVFYPFGAFPFVLPHSAGSIDLVAGYGAPLGLALADAMRWYWRVKQWLMVLNITAAGTAEDSSDAPATASITVTASQHATMSVIGPNTAMPDESYLVLNNGFLIPDGDLAFTCSGDLIAPTAAGALDFQFFADTLDAGYYSGGRIGTHYDPVSGLFYPALSINGDFSSSSTDGTERGPAWFEFVVGPIAGEDGFLDNYQSFPLALTLDGKAAGNTVLGAALHQGRDGGSGYNTFPVTSCTASLTITPAAYWPYANQAGQALYDTTSGALL